MKYTGLITMNSFLKGDCHVPYIESYDFWLFIISKTLKKATDFEIRCWPGEFDAFEIGRKYGEQINNTNTKEIVYRGKINEKFISDITNNFLNDDNTLKWFSIFLLKDGKHIFSSEHYGTQLILGNFEEREKESIQKYAYQYKEINNINLFPVIEE